MMMPPFKMRMCMRLPTSLINVQYDNKMRTCHPMS
ncbi:MAG: hypothetical protein CM15mP79_2670 [Methanobacteriota archaeon]|nr:MAG: hypothetical protein CM15mP79_2670 [Euryarchaeota archaeon]